MGHDDVFTRIHYKDGAGENWCETEDWEADVAKLRAQGMDIIDVERSNGEVLYEKSAE